MADYIPYKSTTRALAALRTTANPLMVARILTEHMYYNRDTWNVDNDWDEKIITPGLIREVGTFIRPEAVILNLNYVRGDNTEIGEELADLYMTEDFILTNAPTDFKMNISGIPKVYISPKYASDDVINNLMRRRMCGELTYENGTL